MQDVTISYSTHSRQQVRRPSFQVLMDWDLDGGYDEESDNILFIEGERVINEPLNGIHQAQMDIKLSNVTGRYSPNSDSPLSDLLRINRRIKMFLGFYGENIPFARGVSQVPVIDELKREVMIHFFDELEVLADYKLTDGDKLYLDVRSDLYIWDILDVVYEPWFQIIASFNSDETWSGDGTIETVSMRGGDGAMRLSSVAGSSENAYRDISLNLSGYQANWDSTIYGWDDPEIDWGDSQSTYTDDNIAFFVFVEDVTKVQTLKIRLHNVVDDAYADLDVTQLDIETGWNQIVVPKGDFVALDSLYPPSTWFTIGVSDIGGSDVIPGGVFDFSDVVRVEFILEATPGNSAYAIFDEVRLTHQHNYPRRYFDLGLQEIPVAAFSGNTALFEIKAAAESEGARFYSDEEGRLHFENRQFYNNNEEFKVSQLQLTFADLINYEHPKGDQGVINSVNVKINPRRIVATKEVWRYGEVVQITNGDTITRWASFIDPVPVTASGLITPVSTTDYTANDQADGLGTDRTANISIVITKFTTGAKLEITNNYTSPVYLTLLKLRGTPAEQQGEQNVPVKDETSIAIYGEQIQNIETKYLASTEYAQILGQQIIDWYKDPIDRVQITHPALPQLQIGDMISVVNGLTGQEQLMRIIGNAFSMGNGQMFDQKTRLRSVNPFELLNFFEIGVSEIGGSDIIAP